ncbi:MAG: ATP-binding cassette domain-containing protein [Propionibacteriaceae bacterium]|jgi:putative ABC transport system ATP-binding protein|nr:ATP-binding cassette domain-containing protein [Propionibacteriaceae bacterium]
MLTLNGVSKTFFPGTVNERQALSGIDLTLDAGDFVTIIGSNGAGKSTLLNVIAGTISPDVGSIQLAGQAINKISEPARARMIARVFQDPQAGTAPHMTIEQNLAIALTRGQLRGLRLGVNATRRERFRRELSGLGLGLEDRMTHRVGLLSGGQRQALSLLMASFTAPSLLLLDEHTAALDPERAEAVLRLTKQVVAQGRLTALMVTHNMEHALRMGNRLLMMHEGRVIHQLDAAAKAKARVSDLLDLFAEANAVLADRTLLG